MRNVPENLRIFRALLSGKGRPLKIPPPFRWQIPRHVCRKSSQRSSAEQVAARFVILRTLETPKPEKCKVAQIGIREFPRVRNKGESNHFLEIDSAESRDFSSKKDPFIMTPFFWSRLKMTKKVTFGQLSESDPKSE